MIPVKSESKYKNLIYEQEETGKILKEKKPSTVSYASYKTCPISAVFCLFLILHW